MKILLNEKRNYGIDLFRIVAMLLITILHSLGHGGVLKNTAALSDNYRAAWLLEIAAYCAVNCYALISGYVGVRSRFRISNIIELWLQVLFYCVVGYFVNILYAGAEFSFAAFKLELFPVYMKRYWYFTAYFAMYMFAPFINAGFEKMNRAALRFTIAALVILFSVYTTLRNVDIFALESGYQTIWLLLIYMIGAYIAKYQPFASWNRFIWLAIYAICVLATWAYNIHLQQIKADGLTRIYSQVNLVRYISPTILLAAVALLQFFSKVRLPVSVKYAVAILSPLTFGVYLIHDNPHIRNIVVKDSLVKLASADIAHMIGGVLLFAISIYAICSLIEFIRKQLFNAIKIKQLLNRLDNVFVVNE